MVPDTFEAFGPADVGGVFNVSAAAACSENKPNGGVGENCTAPGSGEEASRRDGCTGGGTRSEESR